MLYTDDPIRDFERHDAEQAEWLKTRPICSECEEPIQDDYYYEVAGWRFCPYCMETYCKKTIIER